MKQITIINPENVSDKDVNDYAVREAARAVVVDMDSNVALLYVSNEKYYKLPGGGIEGLEDREAALKRECLEEIGSDVHVVSELGSIVEYRKMFNLKQVSYCYFAKLKGEKGNPDFTKEELQNGFKLLWLPYDRALEVLSQNNATSFEGSAYIVPRDTAFLISAKRYFHV